jgi:hypothetical protein
VVFLVESEQLRVRVFCHVSHFDLFLAVSKQDVFVGLRNVFWCTGIDSRDGL